nr:hypothetical protein CFP56_20279 [Quercus suber]
MLVTITGRCREAGACFWPSAKSLCLRHSAWRQEAKELARAVGIIRLGKNRPVGLPRMRFKDLPGSALSQSAGCFRVHHCSVLQRTQLQTCGPSQIVHCPPDGLKSRVVIAECMP